MRLALKNYNRTKRYCTKRIQNRCFFSIFFLRLNKKQKINSCVIPNSLEDLGEFLAICPGTLGNLLSHLPRNLPEPHQPSASKPLISLLPRNPPEPCLLSAPEPSGTSSAICPGTLHNIPQPHQPSAPEPSGTSSAICAGTLRNLISNLHQNPPEPHQLSAPETLRNLISRLHRNPPEPHQPSAPEGSGTLRNLLRNLVLQLHRITPELFWAKDPIASFAVGEKKKKLPCWPNRCASAMQQHH